MTLNKSWTGLRNAVTDTFNSGTDDAELSTTGRWTRQVGSSDIKQDTSNSLAYTKSTANDQTFYLNDIGKFSNNRIVECTIQIKAFNYRAGIIVSGRGTTLKNKFVVYGEWSGTDTDYSYIIATGGSDTVNSIGTVSGQEAHKIKVKKLGEIYHYDINDGELTGNIDAIGDAGSNADKSGIYVKTPGLSFGIGNKVEWTDFKTDCYEINDGFVEEG